MKSEKKILVRTDKSILLDNDEMVKIYNEAGKKIGLEKYKLGDHFPYRFKKVKEKK